MCGVEGLGNGKVFGLEAVFCGYWVLVPQDVERGEGHVCSQGLLDMLLQAADPKAHIFAGAPEMFVSINLSSLQTGEECAREGLVVAP